MTVGRDVRKWWISDLYVRMDRRVAVLMNTGVKEEAAAAVGTTGGVAMEVDEEGRLSWKMTTWKILGFGCLVENETFSKEEYFFH